MRSSATPLLALAVAVLAVSFGSILVRAAHSPALAVALYRTAFAALLLAPFAGSAARASWPRLPRHAWLAMLGAGLALALHFATWIASLAFTSVAASVLLVNTTPLISLVLARALLGEEAPRVVIFGSLLALLGTGVIVHADAQAGPEPLKGDLLALLGALTLSLYHLAGRSLRALLPLPAYLLGVWSSAALVLLALALVFGVPLTGHAPRAWSCFLALALVPTLIGHGLVNHALRRVAAPTVGLFLLGEPVGATLLAWLFFAEPPGPATALGGSIVLAALALVARHGG